MLKPSKLLIILILFSIATPVYVAHAVPSTTFNQKYGDWYDTWDINRNYYAGPKGYLPNLASETLGTNKEQAYSLGESLRSTHPDKVVAAKAILKYVQTWTVYGYDNENVFRDGEAQPEWAWNADEMTRAFNEITGVKATGDCEDLAFLISTIYEGAGINAAVVDAPEHVACLIWLPEYQNANNYWDIPNDNVGSGWIWVEATGESNPLGWTPPDFDEGRWEAYPLSLPSSDNQQSQPPITGTILSAPLEIITLLAIAAAAAIIILVISGNKKKRSYSRLRYSQMIETSSPGHFYKHNIDQIGFYLT